MMSERYLDIKGYKGQYLVSEYGKVWTTAGACGKSIGTLSEENGREYVYLWVSGRREKRYVDELVAEAFINKPLDKNILIHKDGNLRNSYRKNLWYV